MQGLTWELYEVISGYINLKKNTQNSGKRSGNRNATLMSTVCLVYTSEYQVYIDVYISQRLSILAVERIDMDPVTGMQTTDCRNQICFKPQGQLGTFQKSPLHVRKKNNDLWIS